MNKIIKIGGGLLALFLLCAFIYRSVDANPSAPEVPAWVAETETSEPVVAANLRALKHGDGEIYICPWTLAHLMRWEITETESEIKISSQDKQIVFPISYVKAHDVISQMGGQIHFDNLVMQVVFPEMTLLIPVEEAGKVIIRVGKYVYEEMVDNNDPEKTLNMVAKRLEQETRGRVRINPADYKMGIQQLRQQLRKFIAI